jgi:hypothetical protein
VRFSGLQSLKTPETPYNYRHQIFRPRRQESYDFWPCPPYVFTFWLAKGWQPLSLHNQTSRQNLKRILNGNFHPRPSLTSIPDLWCISVYAGVDNNHQINTSTLFFDSTTAFVAPGTPSSHSRQDCRRLNVEFNAGASYDLWDVAHLIYHTLRTHKAQAFSCVQYRRRPKTLRDDQSGAFIDTPLIAKCPQSYR